MKFMKYIIWLLLLIPILGLAGCFKEIVESKQPVPDIIWPLPPDVPRIRFINSISNPEDVNIKETFSQRLLTFFKGKQNVSIVKPYGIATDAEERLYIVDNFTRLVHVFDKKNNTYYTFPDKETEMLSPIDIAIDKRGTIYISDSKADIVRAFNEHGKRYLTDIGREILNRPTGIAVSEVSDELLIVNTTSSEIIRFDINTYKYKGKIGGQGTGPGEFHYPTNISISKDGQIYVSDSLNFRIQVFTPDGGFINSFGRAGDSPGYFARPKGLAVDSDGNIYVVDAIFDNVQMFNKEGTLLMDFGKPGSNYGEFWMPSGIYIDNNDKVYVADSFNKRIQVFQYLKDDEYDE